MTNAEFVATSSTADGAAALTFDGYLSHKPRDHALPKRAEATDVTSAISLAGDSLQVVVSWDLTLSDPSGKPDSIRLKIVSDLSKDSLLAMQPATELADTAYLPAPAPGKTLAGTSCVAAMHPGGPLTETCTPWQYVKPDATPMATVAGVAPNRIVIQPAGLQVDPDLGGRIGVGALDVEDERIAMLRHGIPDLRMFWENDLRVLRQF